MVHVTSHQVAEEVIMLATSPVSFGRCLEVESYVYKLGFSALQADRRIINVQMTTPLAKCNESQEYMVEIGHNIFFVTPSSSIAFLVSDIVSIHHQVLANKACVPVDLNLPFSIYKNFTAKIRGATEETVQSVLLGPAEQTLMQQAEKLQDAAEEALIALDKKIASLHKTSNELTVRTDALDAELRQGTSGLEAKRKEVKLLEGQNASSKLEAAALDAAIVKLNAEVAFPTLHDDSVLEQTEEAEIMCNQLSAIYRAGETHVAQLCADLDITRAEIEQLTGRVQQMAIEDGHA